MGHTLLYFSFEVERREGDTGLSWFGRVLNNFPLSLPGSNLRQGNLACEPDQTLSAFYQEKCPDEVELPGESDHRLDRTQRQWYEDVDKACVASGYTLTETEAALRRFLELRTDPTMMDTAYEEFAAFLIPIYVELRKMGYNPYDIWG